MTATHESLHLSVLSMLFRLSMAKLFLHFQTFRTASFIQVSHAPSIQVERKNAKLSLSFPSFQRSKTQSGFQKSHHHFLTISRIAASSRSMDKSQVVHSDVHQRWDVAPLPIEACQDVVWMLLSTIRGCYEIWHGNFRTVENSNVMWGVTIQPSKTMVIYKIYIYIYWI